MVEASENRQEVLARGDFADGVGTFAGNSWPHYTYNGRTGSGWPCSWNAGYVLSRRPSNDTDHRQGDGVRDEIFWSGQAPQAGHPPRTPSC